MKTSVSDQSNLLSGFAGSARFFDIVNGFFNRCRDVSGCDLSRDRRHARCKIWLRFKSSAPVNNAVLCKAVVDGVDSQA